MKTRNELKVEHIIQTAQDKMKNRNFFRGIFRVENFKDAVAI